MASDYAARVHSWWTPTIRSYPYLGNQPPRGVCAFLFSTRPLYWHETVRWRPWRPTLRARAVSFTLFIEGKGTSQPLFRLSPNNIRLLCVALWNTQPANALIRAVTWSFALMLPPLSLANGCVSVYLQSSIPPVFDFRLVNRTPMSLNCTARSWKRRVQNNLPTTWVALAHTWSLLGYLYRIWCNLSTRPWMFVLLGENLDYLRSSEIMLV